MCTFGSDPNFKSGPILGSYYEQMCQNWNYRIWKIEKIRPKLDIERSKKNQPFNMKAFPHTQVWRSYHTQPKRVHNTYLYVSWEQNLDNEPNQHVFFHTVSLWPRFPFFLCMHNVCMQVVCKNIAPTTKKLKVLTH
jgi:hypothetical protein